jgi:hypothetical protein
MPIDRRRFVAGSAAAALLGGLPAPSFGMGSTPPPAPRMKFEDFVKDSNRVAALVKGVTTMRARKPSDPTSWWYQGAIHGVDPTWVAGWLKSDPGIAQVDQKKFWNQCPHDAPRMSAEFLLWHRGYVYYFERILRAASGDPTLSLPYWNYLEPGQRMLPALYRNGGALQIPQRDAQLNAGQSVLSADAVSVQDAFAANDFFGAVSSTFAGATNVPQVAPGRLEESPHNSVHGAIGGDGTLQQSWMSYVQTAAFDPVFWIHHANIDRLWRIWECTTSRAWGVFDPSWLLIVDWYFHDADGKVVVAPRGGYLNRVNFPVSYDTDIPSCTQMVDRTPPSPSAIPPFAEAIGKGPKTVLVGTGSAVTLSTTAPTTTTIAINVPRSQGRGSLGSFFAAAPNRKVVLEIDNLTYDTFPAVGYHLYVDAAAGSQRPASPGPRGPGYVGSFSFFGHGHRGMTENRSYDISKVARSGALDAGNAHVRIVPFALTTPVRGAHAAPPSKAIVKVGAIKIGVQG